jgi:hypothetical protein
VALQGLENGKNLFVAPDGRWLGGYIPAALRGYPFKVLQDNSEPPRHFLCFDEESDLLVDATEPNSQPFFKEDGTLDN